MLVALALMEEAAMTIPGTLTSLEMYSDFMSRRGIGLAPEETMT